MESYTRFILGGIILTGLMGSYGCTKSDDSLIKKYEEQQARISSPYGRSSCSITVEESRENEQEMERLTKKLEDNQRYRVK